MDFEKMARNHRLCGLPVLRKSMDFGEMDENHRLCFFGLEKVDGFRENSWKSSTFPVFGPIEHLIQLGSCVIAWFFPFQREKFSRRASERRRFGGRAASARALEPFTAPACVRRCARAHEKPSAKTQRACVKSCDSSIAFSLTRGCGILGK